MAAKKFIVFALLIMLPAALLCGCAGAQIDCGVGDDDVAWLSYTLHADKGELASKDWIKLTGLIDSIKKHWQSAGFETNVQKGGDQIELTAVIKKEAASREEAFDALLELMCSDASPFTKVSGDYSESYFSDEYFLSAECDFSGLIPPDNINALPYNLEADVLEILSTSSVDLSISLPGDIVETSGEKMDGGCMVSAGFSEPARVYLKTVYRNKENSAEYDSMLQTRDLSGKLAIGAGILSVVLLAAYIVAVSLWARAAKRSRLAAQLQSRDSEAPIEVPSQMDMEE